MTDTASNNLAIVQPMDDSLYRRITAFPFQYFPAF